MKVMAGGGVGRSVAHAFGGRTPGGVTGACWWDTVEALKPGQVADQIVAPHTRIQPEATQGGSIVSLVSVLPVHLYGTVPRRMAWPMSYLVAPKVRPASTLRTACPSRASAESGRPAGSGSTSEGRQTPSRKTCDVEGTGCATTGGARSEGPSNRLAGRPLQNSLVWPRPSLARSESTGGTFPKGPQDQTSSSISEIHGFAHPLRRRRDTPF